MKVVIRKTGILVIMPENETEEFALTRWKEESIVLFDDLKRYEKKYIRCSRIEITKILSI